jgi:general secretion pathway protein D
MFTIGIKGDFGDKFNRTISRSCCYSNDPILVHHSPSSHCPNILKKKFMNLLMLGALILSPFQGLAADATVVSAVALATPVSTLSPNDKVGPISLHDDTIAQVLDLLQRWTGKTVLRPQALPPNLYTLNLPAGATRSEALLAIETLLNLNGIAVIQQGDRFLKVVPNNVAKSESPSLITESTLTLPASGRVASKIFILKHANGQEVVTQIASMLNTTLATLSLIHI